MPLSGAPDPSEPAGWALIPREGLPAATPAHARPQRRHPPPADAARQLSFFGVESVDASPVDLAGLLAGPGRIHRMGGTARVSVRVDAAWRVHALLAEFAVRGLEGGWSPVGGPAEDDLPASNTVDGDGRSSTDGDQLRDAEEQPGIGGDDRHDTDGEAESDTEGEEDPGSHRAGERFEVRTAYSSLLAGLARAWLPAGAQRVPERLLLTGPRLRLWAVAAGAPLPGDPPGAPGAQGGTGYILRLAAAGPPQAWLTVEAALHRAGLSGVVWAAAPGGPAYRIAGRRRLARLGELVGERPAAAPAGLWPHT